MDSKSRKKNGFRLKVSDSYANSVLTRESIAKCHDT